MVSVESGPSLFTTPLTANLAPYGALLAFTGEGWAGDGYMRIRYSDSGPCALSTLCARPTCKD